MEDSLEEKKSEVKPPEVDSSSKTEKKSNIGMIITIVVIVLIVLSAGGYFASRYIFKSWFDKQTGISVDEDNNSTKLETDDGTVVEGGENIDLPNYWPDDVPIYAKDNINTVGKSGDEDFYLSFISGSTSSEIYNWYLDELKVKGWTIISQFTLNTTSSISAEKDTRVFGIAISKSEEDDDTSSVITVGPKN